ncbi:hypothetical protein ESCAB7627_2819 [Escherichia albertii TW07627]|uniref:Entericidin B n=1 Tax=Escherichia albertii (strain TW07627) TaxID=502347 RepID=A0ABC9NLW8_ESCAT|nr:hypothetical protein ESCAB7627_2819 [Escherichia albertii TW07627]
MGCKKVNSINTGDINRKIFLKSQYVIIPNVISTVFVHIVTR